MTIHINNITKRYSDEIILDDITLKINNWWLGSGRQYNYVPRFINCYLDSINNYIMFSGDNLIGLELRNCYINDISLYLNSNNTGSGAFNFVQSFIMSGCTYWNNFELIKARQLYDCKILDNRIEKGNGTILEIFYDDSFSCYNLNIENNVIESRNSGTFKLKSCINCSFVNNYLEGNNNHLFEITGTKSLFDIVIKNNFFNEKETTDYVFYVYGNIIPRTKCYNNTLLFSGETKLINTSIPISLDYDFYENYGYRSENTYRPYANMVKTTKGFNSITPILNSAGKWTFEFTDYRSIQNNPSPLILSINYGYVGSNLYRSNAIYIIAFGYKVNAGSVVPTVNKKIISCFTGSGFTDKTQDEDVIETIELLNADIKRIKITLKSFASNSFCKVNILDFLNTFQLANKYIGGTV